MNKPVSVVIMGASGNLALTKLLPSLYTLYTSGALPAQFTISGYARTSMTHDEFRTKVKANLMESVEETQLVESLVNSFINKIFYHAGNYGSVEDFGQLKTELDEVNAEFGEDIKRVFYLSIPPAVFEPVIHSLRESQLVEKGNLDHFVVVEKPFGYDTDSARELNATIEQTFDESQVCRIDHYLGKEAIQNLMVMRFANIIFEPVWNRNYIESVTISWEEDKAIGDRGGYFDDAGIIRDVIQNHLLQILALVAMEQPSELTSDEIASEKNRVLRKITPFKAEDVVVGQYTDGVCSGRSVNSYRDEPGVPKDSMRDTFAAVRCEINNQRWSGVPFVVKAGKAMTKSCTEIIIQFKDVVGSIFANQPHHANKLVIRVQPEAGMIFNITNKVPGKGMVLKDVKMDFTYNSGFDVAMPGAYERLLLDAINGDKSLFISYDELIQSWELFTPILKKIDAGENEVHFYRAGTSGPEEANFK
ncbi:glucose-6-phosphate dehydrogenase [Lentisphaera marina]|uniref:glucose-6-phosphate dehydrogenase n=1 Tax=Lentisphaera marina TaxID=1111041 RepID=UPI00236666C8|nr:glucose-6-phosphate dehydrogenase [Lentisphaera marina]MDD7987045.1 glucose-6-phosphate dehydrogenase [Lentisphaera marina]